MNSGFLSKKNFEVNRSEFKKKEVRLKNFEVNLRSEFSRKHARGQLVIEVILPGIVEHIDATGFTVVSIKHLFPYLCEFFA